MNIPKLFERLFENYFCLISNIFVLIDSFKKLWILRVNKGNKLFLILANSAYLYKDPAPF